MEPTTLAAATYSYSATKDGYVDITDAELVVAAGDVTTGTKEVTVTMTKYCVVTFTKTPTDLTLVVGFAERDSIRRSRRDI